MKNNAKRNKTNLRVDAGKKQFREGKIGSGYMSTIEGQPFLKDMARITSKKDHQVRAREIEE